MDMITPALLNGVGVVAVVLMFGIGYTRAIATGLLITRREADGITRRAEKAEETRDSLIAQNTELMEMARLGQATFAALQKGAEK